MTFATSADITVVLKITYGQEIRRVSFTGDSFSALRSLVATLFSLDQERITIKYKDSDGDLITMVLHSTSLHTHQLDTLIKYLLFFFQSLDNELHEAIQLALASQSKSPLRLFVEGMQPLLHLCLSSFTTTIHAFTIHSNFTLHLHPRSCTIYIIPSHSSTTLHI